MDNFIYTLNVRKLEWIASIVEHIQISLISLLIAIFIAVPLSILIVRKRRVKEIVLQVTGIFQTLPSLALLGLLIPILGIGIKPAVVALVIYALFPITQNTVTGLSEIDSSLEEAAEAFGMTKYEKLKKFELELAMPMIISGIRTAAVMIIGTATLAALIGAGGLGSFILLGIDRNNTALILIGAISSALLAILFSIGIKILEKQKLKVIISSLISIIIILLLTFVPRTTGSKKIVIAGKLGAEPEIIINMYKELIEDKLNMEVEVKANFGKTTFLYEALKSKEIDIYPEYTGTVLATLLKDNNQNVSNDPREVYELTRDKILEQDNLVYLEPMSFQNTYAIAVKKEFAEKENLKNISDLKRVEKYSKAGFTLEFNDRKDGNEGLKNLYGLSLTVKTMEPSLRYQAINNNEVQIVDAYSTDSEIKEYALIMLKDTKQLFPPYQGAPLIREETLKEYPELKNILGVLSNKISEEEMSMMNFEVRVKGKSASEVAKKYLKDNNFID